MEMTEEKELYEKYLPDVVKGTRQFQKLAEIEGPVLAKERQTKKDLTNDQWILTSTERGLFRRGFLLGISKKPDETMEQFRQRVLYRWNEHSPYTYYTMTEWLDGLCGKTNCTNRLFYEEYRLYILLELQMKKLRSEIMTMLRRMIPANIVLDITLNYNKHGDYKKQTHGWMKRFTQFDIRETYIPEIQTGRNIK